MTQRQQILERLKARPTCGTVFLKMQIPRYAARISELRGDGWWITTRRCREAGHGHRTRQVVYTLKGRGRL